MSNPSKQRGTRFETDVVRYLNEQGVSCERRALQGAADKGDIAGIRGWVLELKCHREMALGSWAKEAAVEAARDNAAQWAVIHKRRMHGIQDAFVTIPLSTFVKILKGDNGR